MGCCTSVAAPTPKTSPTTTTLVATGVTPPSRVSTKVKTPTNTAGDQEFAFGLNHTDGVLIGRHLCSITLDARVKATTVFENAHSKKGSLSKKELKTVFFKINMSIPRDRLTELFKQFDTNNDDSLQREEFVALFVQAEWRPDIIALYEEFDIDHKGYWTPEDLRNFYVKTAPEDVLTGWRIPDLDACAALIKKYCDMAQKAASWAKQQSQSRDNRLFLDGIKLLLSDPDINGPWDPDKIFTVYQDMSHPLSHYFISSSHNTYLDGNQLKSRSSAESVAEALKLGIRVIELDAWDGEGGEPIVNHGRTLCTHTSFLTCVEAIRDHAFSASKYPVILTIENHCTREQQGREAEILSQVLGSSLFRYTPPLDADPFDGPAEWLSPQDLMNKIVLRDKPKRLKPPRKTSATSLRKSLFRKSKRNTTSTAGAVKGSAPPRAQRTTYAPSSNTNGASETRVQISLSTSDPSLNPEVMGGSSGKDIKVPLHKGDGGSGRSAVSSGSTDMSRRTRVRSGEGDVDDDEDDFIDDLFEEEGITTVFRDAGDMAQEGLVKAGAKLGIDMENVLETVGKQIPTWLNSTRQLGGDSVPELLELCYIKNVKLRVRRSPDPVLPRKSISANLLHHKRKSLIALQDVGSAGSNTSVASTPSHAGSGSPVLGGGGGGSSPSEGSPNYDGLITYEEPPWRSSSSIAEAKLISLSRPGFHCAALSTYASNHLVRCYPKSSRVDSSNYDPVPAWNAGVQIVALNAQTKTKPLWVSQGQFTDNGGCGWILKPTKMLNARPCGRSKGTTTEEDLKKPYWDLVVSPQEPRDMLTIILISGHRLPKPKGANPARSEIIDPFVEFHFHGVEEDIPTSLPKSKWINNNGFDPRWDEQFKFEIAHPELAHLVLVVRDHDDFSVTSDQFIGQASIPLRMMRPGYRSIPLRRADCTPIPDAHLFCKIEWRRAHWGRA